MRDTDPSDDGTIGLQYIPEKRRGVLLLHPQAPCGIEFVFCVAYYEILRCIIILLINLKLNRTTEETYGIPLGMEITTQPLCTAQFIA